MRCSKKVGHNKKAVVKNNSLQIHLIVILYDSYRSNMSREKSLRIHGIRQSSSCYSRGRWILLAAIAVGVTVHILSIIHQK